MIPDSPHIRKILYDHAYPQMDTGKWGVLWSYLVPVMLILGYTAKGRLSLLVVLIFVVAALVVAVWRDFFAGLVSGQPAPPPKPPDAPSCWGRPDSRLQCVGRWAELHDLPEASAPRFEPFICKPSFLYLPAYLRMPPALTALVFNSFHGPAWLLLPLVIGFFPAMWIVFAVRQRYYCVVPGRLDLLAAWAFSNSPKLSRSVDLSTAAITCRYDSQLLIIDPLQQGQSPLHIKLAMFEEPHEFVRTVFRAALSGSPAEADAVHSAGRAG